MRLDVDKGDTGWHIWHVEECRSVKCRWIDDELRQYCELHGIHAGTVDWRVHQARRIEILREARTVLINPIEGLVDDGAHGSDVAIGYHLKRWGAFSSTGV